jgi:hypothetical protein
MTLTVALVPGTATAQRIQGGIQGGVSFSNLANLTNAIDFGGPIDVNRRTGIVIGPFVAFPVNETVAVQVEGLFTARGATPTDGTNELQIRLSYLDVPILLRLAPSRARPLYVLLGPSINFNVSAKTTDVVPSGVEEDVKDVIRNAEFGLVFGAGVAAKRALVEARYSAGLTDIVGDRAAAAISIDAPIRNRAFAILAGIRF